MSPIVWSMYEYIVKKPCKYHSLKWRFLASRSRRDVVVLADNNIHIENEYFKFFVSISVSTRACH